MTRLEQRVSVWDAINKYTEACGGDAGRKTGNVQRMDAVVEVEKAISSLIDHSDKYREAILNYCKNNIAFDYALLEDGHRKMFVENRMSGTQIIWSEETYEELCKKLGIRVE